MAPLTVDPAALNGAGAAVISIGDGVAAASGPLTSGFGANTGQDAAGEVFGLAYQDSAKNLLKAVAAAVNACRITGFKVQVCASNYSRAEAASTLGGGGAVLPTPSEPGKFDAAGAPWTLGPGIPEPALWTVVEAFVGDLWPNGNAAQMHAAGACWRTFGAALHGVKDLLHSPGSVVAAQQVPEGGLIQQVFSKLGDDIAKVGDECDKLAKGLDDFANEVQHAEDNIRDLLHRLGTPSGVLHEVVQLFSGHGLDEIKKIANDIKGVLHNMKREADAKEQLFQQAMNLLDSCAVDLEHFADKEFTHFLGTDIGSVASGLFNADIDIGEGLFLKGPADFAHSLSQLNPMRFAYDPNGALHTWEGLAKLAQMATNPALIPAVLASDPKGTIDMVKGLTDYKDWSSDRPLVGLGHNLFDIGSAVVPGLGEAGAATKGAEAAAAAGRGADAADAVGAVGRDGRALGEVGEFASTTEALSDITKSSSGLTSDLNKIGTDFPKSDLPPGGRPAALPPPRPGEPPAGPTSPPVDSAPPVSPQLPADPSPAPALGSPEPGVVPSPSEHPVAAPAAPGEYVPSANPQMGGPAPAEAPLPPYGASADPAPAVAEAPGMPHVQSDGPPPPPSDAPGAVGGDSGRSGAGHEPEPPQLSGPVDHPPDRLAPHDGLPHGPGDGAPAPSDGASQTTSDGGSSSATPHALHGGHTPPEPPQKVPGIDYPYPPRDALTLLDQPQTEIARLTDGGVPSKVLDGYDPLAGRTPEQFKQDFTVSDTDGNLRWDWNNQAPNHGFAEIPEEADRIPSGMPLDRIGPNGGAYMSPEGTPLAERAPAPGLASQYHAFEGTGLPVPPDKNWVVLHGPAKEAFGQPGGAPQWVVIDRTTGLEVPVEELKDEGILWERHPPGEASSLARPRN